LDIPAVCDLFGHEWRDLLGSLDFSERVILEKWRLTGKLE
jgi:hypothetical protein